MRSFSVGRHCVLCVIVCCVPYCVLCAVLCLTITSAQFALLHLSLVRGGGAPGPLFISHNGSSYPDHFSQDTQTVVYTCQLRLYSIGVVPLLYLRVAYHCSRSYCWVGVNQYLFPVYRQLIICFPLGFFLPDLF